MTIKQSLAKNGSKNPMAILTEKNVRAIRKYAKKTNLKRGWKTKLAIKYGVAISTISNIVSGKSWKNLDQDYTLFSKLEE